MVNSNSLLNNGVVARSWAQAEEALRRQEVHRIFLEFNISGNGKFSSFLNKAKTCGKEVVVLGSLFLVLDGDEDIDFLIQAAKQEHRPIIFAITRSRKCVSASFKQKIELFAKENRARIIYSYSGWAIEGGKGLVN